MTLASKTFKGQNNKLASLLQFSRTMTIIEEIFLSSCEPAYDAFTVSSWSTQQELTDLHPCVFNLQLNVNTGEEIAYALPVNLFPQEPVFVSKPDPQSEDDGIIMVQGTDVEKEKGQSKLDVQCHLLHKYSLLPFNAYTCTSLSAPRLPLDS